MKEVAASYLEKIKVKSLHISAFESNSFLPSIAETKGYAVEVRLTTDTLRKYFKGDGENEDEAAKNCYKELYEYLNSIDGKSFLKEDN